MHIEGHVRPVRIVGDPFQVVPALTAGHAGGKGKYAVQYLLISKHPSAIFSASSGETFFAFCW